MAAQVVSFEVSIDDQGVVQGFKRIDSAAAAMGNTGTRVFQSLSRHQHEARESAELFSHTLGINLPRSLQKILANLPAVSGALSKLFATGAVLAFGAAIVGIVNNFDEMENAIRKAGFQLSLFGDRVRGMFGGDMSTVIGQRVQKDQGFLAPVIDQVRQLNEQADIASKVGFGAISANARKTVNDLKRLRTEQINKTRDEFGVGTDRSNYLEGIISGQTTSAILAAEKVATAERIKLRRQLTEETRKQEEETNLIGLEGANKTLQEERNMFADLERLKKEGLIDEQNYQDRKLDIARRTDKAITFSLYEQQKAYQKFRDQVEEEALTGDAKILASTRHRLDDENREFEQNYGLMKKDDANYQLAYATHQQMLSAIARQGEVERLNMFRDNIKQVGQDFEQIWDDLTGGNIGKRILKNVKALAGQIAAQFFLQMRAIKGPMSNLLASLIFGPGSQSAGLFGANPNAVGTEAAGGGLLGLGAVLGGGGAINTGTIFGGASGTPGIFNLGGGVGGPIMATGASIAGVGSTGSTVQAGGLGGGSQAAGLALAGGYARAGAGGSFLGGLGGMLKGAPPLIGALLGKKLGGVGGMIGLGLLGAAAFQPGMIQGIAGLFGTTAMTAAGAFGAIGGGAAGFGIGAAHGPMAGSLSGAGIGLATAALLGAGPVGLAIAGIIGLLSGIFGGLFGGGKRKKAANSFVDSQVEPEIKKILNQYKGFQLDYASALSGLDQLKSDAETQLKKLKGEGKSIFNKRVIPDIDAARKEIESTEMERQRRSGLVFGPPQFAMGGYTGNGARNQFAGVVHAREFVNNADSTSKPGNRRAMEYMNAGGDIENLGVGGGGVHVHVHTMDAKSMRQWLRSGGAAEIAEGLAFHRRYGT